MKSRTALFAALVASFTAGGMTAEAEEFQRLSGTQIRTKLSGMQLTDESHWGEIDWPNGKLTSDEMGNARVGRWRIVKDQF